MSDSSDNGAGYSRRLADREVIEGVFSRIENQLTPDFESVDHAAECDASCPDCLQSYENRRLHPFLDWRLGLDLAAVAAGRELPLHRWLDRAQQEVTAFAAGFEVELIQLGLLWGVLEPQTRRAAFFGHPLWRLDHAYWVPAQVSAADEARAEHGASAVQPFDLHTLARRAHNVISWLVDG